MALQNGVDVKTASSMLGHYSAGFTLDTYDAMNHPVPEAIWWISGSKLLVPPFIEGFLSYLREYLKELEVM